MLLLCCTSQLPIRDKNKNTLTDKSEILNRWKEYGQDLFCKPQGDDQLPTPPNDTPEPPIPPEPPPLLHEVEDAIRLLSNGKSPGLDNIPAELIKATGIFGKKAIHRLCVKIWETFEWPHEWKQQEFVVLHKSGDKKECSNYRTIALISHISKILLYIILKRLKLKLEFEISEEQAGFRQGRGTADMLCALQVLIEKVTECTSVDQATEGYIVFIDYSKAFDNVSHPKLFETMTQMGFAAHLIKLIQSLYHEQEAVIRWNNERTETFNIHKGVRQGCILSPHLFSVYTEQIMRDSNTHEYGINIGGRKVSNLRYADDTALCADNYEDICTLLNNINEEGKKKNMKLNAKKTKVMHIGKGNYNDISIDGETLEKVLEFIYLGSCKTVDGDCKVDINRRIARAKSKMIDLQNIWKDKDLSMSLKLRIMKVLVWTTLNYGAEGWTLKAEDRKKIMSAEMWMYQRMLNLTWRDKRTHVSILDQLKVKRELFGNIVKRKLTFFGHIMRSKNNRLVPDIIQGKIEGRRGRGRPRICYIDNVRQWTEMKMGPVIQACQDREA